MDSITIRFFAELCDFLPRTQQEGLIRAPCPGHETIKHVIEALGVPHPEVAALVVNTTAVDFTYLVQAGDSIEVYPASMLPTITLVPLRAPLGELRFVLDAHLGRLAAYLRMLGLDTLYNNAYEDAELARLSHNETRMLLTRDIGLLKRSLVTYGYFVRSTAPQQQLREVVQRFQISSVAASFQRCIRCNGHTVWVEKAQIEHLLEPKTRQFYHEFQQCTDCRQVYWRGSHYERMQQLVEQILYQPNTTLAVSNE